MFKTVKQKSFFEYIDKKSKFIGYCFPIQNEDEAISHINDIKSQHRKASHNVYAYILKDNNISRYSDDGEPQGTAGLPVLDILKKNELVDILIVITRYFGGTLLGTGGLVRAYTASALGSIENSHITEIFPFSFANVVCDYIFFDKIKDCILKNGGNIINTLYDEHIHIFFKVKSELYDNICNIIKEISKGSCKITFEKSELL